MSDVIKVLEELKTSIGKVKNDTREVTNPHVWGGFTQRHHNAGNCRACGGNPGHTNPQWARFQHNGNWTCGNCVGKNVEQIYTAKSTNGSCHRCRQNCGTDGHQWPGTGWQICKTCAGGSKGASGEQVMAKLDAKIKSEKKKVTDMAKKNKTIEEAAIPYINSGLAEPFAIAIARDVSLIDQILDLWEQDWWKQYPPEDILVCAVLDGELSEDDGRWLNEIRSDHERLALACVTKDIELDWARALLGAGYLDHPEAVPDVLDGGHPVAIARIRRIKVDSDLLPPQLGFSLSKSKKNERASSSPITTADYQQIEKILLKLNNKDLKKILDGHQPLNGTDDWMRGWISNTWERINSRRFPKNEMVLGLRTLADDIILKGRSSMKRDQLRKSILALRTSLRSRISSAMKKHDLTFE